MISLETIEQEILELEKKDTSYTVLERLSWLYICRDHLNRDAAAARASAKVETGGSDFLDACCDKCVGDILEIVNEYVEALRAVYPKSYETIMNRMRQL